MRYFTLIFVFLLMSCKQEDNKKATEKPAFQNDLTISFGSCNNQRIPNILFDEILKNKPKVFIWGGDVIYSDTDDAKILEANYKKFEANKSYRNFKRKVKVIGTWDDHDYALNDGGIENPIKKASQQLFLDFLEVPKDDKRRVQEGVYYAETIKKGENSVKILVLDTRYFRTELTKDSSGEKRYIPNKYAEGTMLGEQQWKWLENELSTSKADFNIIVSSIQFLSNKHGFEAWGNMPHEVDKLEKMIINSKAKNTIILSGDRHIAEVSIKNIGDYRKPLVDITSSGLTHSYTNFHGEENPFRVTNVVYQINFGLLKFDFENNKILFEIRGKNNKVLEHFTQQY